MTAHLSDRAYLIRRARRAINWYKSDPDHGEVFITSSGRIGRIVGERMCGRCPEGMILAYDIEWLGERRA